MGYTFHDFVLRVTPPRAHKLDLTREYLLALSPDIAGRSLIVLRAPSGYGKTSLLLQWRKQWINDGSVVAWLVLDQRESDKRFLQGLMIAFEIACGKTRPQPVDMSELPANQSGLDLLQELLTKIEASGKDTVFILDDLHHFVGAVDVDIIHHLIQHAPTNLRIVLSSREVLDLSEIEKHISLDNCCVLGQSSLKFRREETYSVLANWSNAAIERSDADTLHELICGWPLGLQFVMSVIGKPLNLKDAVKKIAERGIDLERYFAHLQVEGLSPDAMRFLVEISVLKKISPALCNDITGVDDARHLLASLCRSTPIFIETSAPWLKIHPLFKNFLREQWMLLPIERRNAIHLRAMHWFARESLDEEAAYHALQAGESRLAYDMMDRFLYRIVEQGKFNEAEDWLALLPREEIERRPNLRLALTWILAMSKRHGEVEQHVKPLLEAFQLTRSEEREYALIRAFAAFHRDRIHEFQSHIAPWLNVPMEKSGRMNKLIFALHALDILCRDEPQAARYFLSTSVPLSQPFDTVSGFSTWVIGITYLWEGQVRIAEKFLHENLLLAERDIGRRSGITLSLAVTLSFVLLELGQPEEARKALSVRMELVEQYCSPIVIALASMVDARLLLIENKAALAHDRLRELCVIGEVRDSPTLQIFGLAERIRLHAWRFEAFTCVALKEELDSIGTNIVMSRSGIFSSVFSLTILVAHVYVAMARREWHEMLDLLSQADALLNHLHRGRERLHVVLLHALATIQLGGNSDAVLDEAFSLAEMYGLRQMTKDFLPFLGAWGNRYQAARHLGERIVSVKQAELPVKVAPADAQLANNSGVHMQNLLTPKEHQILFLLTRHMTNKEIGNAMNICEETVKWHLKNMYGKLQAGTRKHVVARAKRIGIIE
ncbi:LuxR family maltose regulon positive regulatory protein [Herbaspirillum sp. Sphag1AN]|uniref:helix-turn-helix transcriptional regulator n=1 Tax=unclassified Herbaspirillum TaxID=2624150 RepID=UPI0016114018|nr:MULTISPECIES: LuxR C-terminal-related transcriptional regulator [unclassified Herbaspirillum]MBB3211353.1 LuxR family maltose regulon positive regulatory protein [Herbaspirillum sp. Sphag1AN]MBB3245380.1 LuxR family maltose regulon positive regulatory protein [Herbaspirillum sp. Sphag64]